MQRILGRRDAPPAPSETPADAAPVEPATPPPEGPAAIDGPGVQHPAAVATAAAAAEADTTVTPPPQQAATTTGADTTAAPSTEARPATPDAAATPAGVEPETAEPAPDGPSFRERGRMRRRLRFLRRLRELGYRDLGGLVFEQHRFARADEALVRGKVDALTAVDRELRALEAALGERRAVTELREPGLTACARCGAVIGSDARFCSSCGAPVAGGHGVATVGGAAATAPPPAQEMPPGEATERMAAVAPDDRPTLATRPADPAP